MEFPFAVPARPLFYKHYIDDADERRKKVNVILQKRHEIT